MAMIEDKVLKLLEVAELHKVMEPQVFKEPKEMIVWNNDNPKICKALEILPNGKIICEGHIWYNHGAFIPDHPKPRRATNRELSRWLAQGNGELCNENDYSVSTAHSYEYDVDNPQNYDDDEVWYTLKVRKWDDTEWHEPDVDYMGLEDK